jgi:hypothetical protein
LLDSKRVNHYALGSLLGSFKNELQVFVASFILEHFNALSHDVVYDAFLQVEREDVFVNHRLVELTLDLGDNQLSSRHDKFYLFDCNLVVQFLNNILRELDYTF